MRKLYPLGDTPTAKETGNAPAGERMGSEILGTLGRYRAVSTGEKRAPKAGEWYLSGAIVTAYKAPNDLSQVFNIAKLVRVKRLPETWVECAPI